MKKMSVVLVMVVSLVSVVMGAPVYLVDFNHGPQLPAPSPYLASGSEVIPAGADMSLFDPGAQAELTGSGVGALEGGESLWIKNAGDPWQGGYNITNSPTITTSRTIEFLIKPSFSYNEPDLYVMMESTGSNFDQTLYIRGNVSSNKHKLEWYPSYQAAGVSTLRSSTVLQHGQWYHVGLVMDSVSQTVGLYLDGNLEASCAIPSTWVALYPIHSNFSVGCALGMTRRNYTGLMDAFCIDDTALSASEFHLIPEPASCLLLSLGVLSVVRKRKV